MCGITGILRWNGPHPQPEEIHAMTHRIAHRGPDGESFHIRDQVALGHRRLAIIDLSTGDQPITNEDETVWLIYNGELYNYKELSDYLRQKGHQFVTESDTEVVVHAYEEWGPACVERFRGMFAFALVDYSKRQLFLARDHFGIKPLHYRVGDGYLAFASELEALLEVNDAPPTGNLQSVEYFLRFDYIPAPHTIYHDVYKLPPASYLTIDFDGIQHGPVKYWDGHFKPIYGLSGDEWEERAHEVIRDSVHAHLISDVPFGAFLSGGIDSTLVVHYMSQLLKHPVKAFSIGFNEAEYSELPYAQEAAERSGVELISEIVEPESLKLLPDLISHYGEPFGDSSAIPTWHVSRLAREHVPMVLSGDGGDEGFGGYTSYQAWMRRNPWKQIPKKFDNSLRAGLSATLRTSLRQIRYGTQNSLDVWQRSMQAFSVQRRQSLWSAEHHSLIGTPSNVFEASAQVAQRWDRLSYAQYIDYQTYLPNDILTKVDIASMYHGLEARPPLIDIRVFELIASLPYEQKMTNTSSDRFEGKYLLKKLLQRENYSDKFVNRPKTGFSIPRQEWLLDQAGSETLRRELLSNPDPRMKEWFNTAAIEQLVDSHDHGNDMSRFLWLLLVLDIWLKQHPDIHFH